MRMTLGLGGLVGDLKASVAAVRMAVSLTRESLIGVNLRLI